MTVSLFLSITTKFIGRQLLKKLLKQVGLGQIVKIVSKAGGLKKLFADPNKLLKITKIVGELTFKKLLRELCGSSYIFIDLIKYGVKNTIREVIKNKFIPQNVRLLGQLIRYLKNAKNKQEAINFVSQEILTGGEQLKIHIVDNVIIFRDDTPLKVIDSIIKIKRYTGGDKELIELIDVINNKILAFNVNSPQTHNFSQRTHYYNIGTQEYYLPIRSGSHKYIKYYNYTNATLGHVKAALAKVDYGVIVFGNIRLDGK